MDTFTHMLPEELEDALEILQTFNHEGAARWLDDSSGERALAFMVSQSVHQLHARDMERTRAVTMAYTRNATGEAAANDPAPEEQYEDLTLDDVKALLPFMPEGTGRPTRKTLQRMRKKDRQALIAMLNSNTFGAFDHWMNTRPAEQALVALAVEATRTILPLQGPPGAPPMPPEIETRAKH